ncbi:MAG: hypothetical protein JWO38_88 [Gemmataceae bacterium]|nr:hypothetical protein [Gemmataceae bacterium]
MLDPHWALILVLIAIGVTAAVWSVLAGVSDDRG